MQMDAGLDTGPVLMSRSAPLRETDTGVSLTASLADLGADALLEALGRLDTLEPVPQDNALATFAPRLTGADAVINWRRSAASIARQVRALAHRRTAYTTTGNDRLRVLEAQAVGLQGSERSPGSRNGVEDPRGGRRRLRGGSAPATDRAAFPRQRTPDARPRCRERLSADLCRRCAFRCPPLISGRKRRTPLPRCIVGARCAT